MGRILAIDYGRKRCGLAVTDPLKLIATGLRTVEAHELIPFLRQYLPAEGVERIVVGEPRNLDGSATDASALVAEGVRVLEKNFPSVPVTLLDERFTSRMASAAILASGVSRARRRDKALVDEVSATILLQGYLQSV